MNVKHNTRGKKTKQNNKLACLRQCICKQRGWHWEFKNSRTFVTKGSSEGRVPAVAGEAVLPLHTHPLVLTEGAVAAAVARAPGSDPRGDLGPSLQVQSDAVQLQGADASQEALLPGRRPPCRTPFKYSSHACFTTQLRRDIIKTRGHGDRSLRVSWPTA